MQLSDVVAARSLLDGVATTTPCVSSRWLSDLAGTTVRLKCENLQRTGSFKIRGAYVRISRLSEQERSRGVVAASAGNHAQGVALAAAMLDTRARIFMPEGAAIPKVSATRGYGAEVEFVHGGVTEAVAEAQAYAARTGAEFIHPFDHDDILAGQGTVGLEIVEQVPDVRTILVPIGGGGLAAGIALLREQHPDVRIVGVQAEAAGTYGPSLSTGAPVEVAMGPTMADGIAVSRPGQIPFEVIAQHLDEVLTVSEEAMSQALLQLLERTKMLVEPSGAAGVAALMEHPGRFEGPVVAVLSGGNIDALVLMEVIRHGLNAAGRFLAFRVRIPDRPGELMRLLVALAELQVNILNVQHDRTSESLGVRQVEVALQVSTRGTDQQQQVRETLTGLGYDLL